MLDTSSFEKNKPLNFSVPRVERYKEDEIICQVTHGAFDLVKLMVRLIVSRVTSFAIVTSRSDLCGSNSVVDMCPGFSNQPRLSCVNTAEAPVRREDKNLSVYKRVLNPSRLHALERSILATVSYSVVFCI